MELYQNIIPNIHLAQTSTFKRACLRKGGKVLRRSHSGKLFKLGFVGHSSGIKLNGMKSNYIFRERTWPRNLHNPWQNERLEKDTTGGSVELYLNKTFNNGLAQTSTFKRACVRKCGKPLRRGHSGKLLKLDIFNILQK